MQTESKALIYRLKDKLKEKEETDFNEKDAV